MLVGWITIGLSILLAAVILFGSGLEFVAALNTAETVALLILHIGVSVMFFMGSGVFRLSFKKAFVFVSVGILLLALAVLQYTILGSANALESFWVTSGAIEIAFILSIGALLVGQAKFARIMGVPNLARYIWTTVIVAVIIGAIATQVPSARTDISAETLSVSAALYAFQAVLLVAFVPLAYRIRREAGALYAPLFAWLFTAWLVYALQLCTTVYGLFYFPHDHWYVVYGATMIFFFVAGLCLFKAAIELNRIRFTEPPAVLTKLSFYGKPLHSAEEHAFGPYQAITYVAGLSSSIQQIDPILDGLREITAIANSQNLTVDQQHKLVNVYLQLETYLTTKERIGQFTQKDLRERVIQKFQDRDAPFFWEALQSNSASVQPSQQ